MLVTAAAYSGYENDVYLYMPVTAAYCSVHVCD